MLIFSFVGILIVFSSIVLDNISPNIIYEAEDLRSQTGQIIPDMNTSGGFYRFAAANESGAVVFGPYIRLPKGEYTASFRLNAPEGFTSEKIATIDICTHKGKTIKNRTIIYGRNFENPGSYQSFVLPFRSDDESDFEFRVFKDKGGIVSVDSITISPASKANIYKYMFFKSIKIILLLIAGLILAFKLRTVRLGINKNKTAILFIFVLFAYVAIILGLFGPIHGITGDEPHYLITTYSIINDHDIYIEDNYLNEDYREFFPAWLVRPHITQTVGGRWISVHEIGLSILLIIPYYLFGVLGVRLFLAIIAALMVVTTFIFIKELSGNEDIALAVSLIAAFTSPLLFYSFSIYPEIIAALILVYSTRILYKTSNQVHIETHTYVLCGIMIASMPWLGIKYVSLMLPLLLLFFVYTRYETVNFVSVFIPILISFISYAYFMLYMFGSLLPTSRYTGANLSGVNDSMHELLQFGVGAPPPNFSVLNAISPSHIASFFFDQQIGLILHSPIYILSFIGVAIIILNIRDKSEFETGFLLLFPSTCYFFTYAASGFYGGGAPLSRPLVAILPLIIVLLCIGLLFISQKMIKTTVDVLAVLSLGIAYILIKNYGAYIQSYSSRLLTNIIDSPFVDLTTIFPSFITRNSFDDWIYLALWLMLFIIFVTIEYIYRQQLIPTDMNGENT